MEIWCIHLRKSSEIQTSLIFSNEMLTVSKTGYNLDIMRQTTCLVFNPIMVEAVVQPQRLGDGFDVKL